MAGEQQGRPFLADALAVWNMGNDVEQGIEATGEVRRGVKLEGADRQASLDRGGDGAVADFSGGYLRVGTDRKIDLVGKYMTLYVRIRDSGNGESVPIFARDDDHDPHGVFLTLNKNGFRYVWRTLPAKEMVLPGTDLTKWSKAIQEGAIPLEARLPATETTAWHDVVMRFDNAKLELFIDGVQMAYDWPHGELLKFTGPFLIGGGHRYGKIASGLRGQIDSAALWNRAVSDDEIVRLSGGRATVAERRGVLGPKYTWPLQHWSLPTASVGDPMTLFSDNTFHVFLGVMELHFVRTSRC